jgi:hypothetical protein
MKNLLTVILFLTLSNVAFSQETLKIVWPEKYEWKLLSNQEDGNIHMIEVIPGKENAEDWTMLGQMLSIKGALNVPMEEAKKMMFDQTKVNSPNAKLRVLDKNEADQFPWIIFKIENPISDENQNPESQLWYIRQGNEALYVNFIAMKTNKLKDGFLKNWSDVFKASEIVQLTDATNQKN